MQTTPFPEYLDATVKGIEEDLSDESSPSYRSMHLTCTESATPDYYEYEGGTPNGYSGFNVTHVIAYAHGFAWEHPNGGTVRAEFAKPIMVAQACFRDGRELDYSTYTADVAKGILAKLGSVGGTEWLKQVAGV